MTGGDLSRIGRGWCSLIKAIAFLCGVFVPLGICKFFEIMIWLWNHINISWVGTK